MLQKVVLIFAGIFLFMIGTCFAELSQDQKFNVNYTGINGEKLSFDHEEGSSQIVVKNKSTKSKPIDIILKLKNSPDTIHDKRILTLRRMDVAGKSFWYVKSSWSGKEAVSINTQFWLIGECNGKIVPYATEKIFGDVDTYDSIYIMPAQAYRKQTANGVFNPEPVLVVEKHLANDYLKMETAIIYWDEDAQWFSYTGKYLYPYPVYVDGKEI